MILKLKIPSVYSGTLSNTEPLTGVSFPPALSAYSSHTVGAPDIPLLVLVNSDPP